MKILHYPLSVIAWQLGLAWYWSYGLAIVVVMLFYYLVCHLRFKYGWFS